MKSRMEQANTRVRKYTVIAGLLMLSLNLDAQTLSLDSVLHVVDRQNPMLQTYRNRARAMDIYSSGSKSLMAPEVGGGLWMFPYVRQDDRMTDTRQIMLSISQTFTNPTKLKARQRYMASQARIEQASERVAFNELRSQAKLAYYRWHVFEQRKQVLQESEEILNLMIQVNQLRFPYNQSKLSSIYKAEARLHEIKNMQLMNDTEIHHQMTELAQLMNLSGEVTFLIDTTSVSVNRVYAHVDTTLLAASRSDIHQLDYTIEAMRLNQQVEQTQTKPDFNLSFNHMISVGQGMPDQFMLLGMVTIPIAPWSSKMFRANQQGMSHEIESMKSERKAILNEVQGMTRNMVTEISSLKQQLSNLQTKIIPALRKNYELLFQAYEENKEELPMVIEGWEALNMMQLQYFDTLNTYYEMIVRYEKEIER